VVPLLCNDREKESAVLGKHVNDIRATARQPSVATIDGLWRMPFSRMWGCVIVVWTDVSEKRIASFFRVEKCASEEPARTGGADCVCRPSWQSQNIYGAGTEGNEGWCYGLCIYEGRKGYTVAWSTGFEASRVVECVDEQPPQRGTLSRIWDLRGGDYEEYFILGCPQPPTHGGSFSRIFLSWRWRRYVPPKRRFTQELHGATSQKSAFFIVTAVKTSIL
jgi:hypothetical protein